MLSASASGPVPPPVHESISPSLSSEISQQRGTQLATVSVPLQRGDALNMGRWRKSIPISIKWLYNAVPVCTVGCRCLSHCCYISTAGHTRRLPEDELCSVFLKQTNNRKRDYTHFVQVPSVRLSLWEFLCVYAVYMSVSMDVCVCVCSRACVCSCIYF